MFSLLPLQATVQVDEEVASGGAGFPRCSGQLAGIQVAAQASLILKKTILPASKDQHLVENDVH